VIVKNRAIIAFDRLDSRRLWCDHVTVTPDAKSTAVFKRGTLNGFRGWIPIGGQQHPNSGVGANLLWKNAQKNAKKNITSEVMNRIIPILSPVVTGVVWWPWKVLSRITSRHHWIIDKIITIIAIINKIILLRWNHEVMPVVSKSAPMEAVRGQGLISTKWNGCRTIKIFRDVYEYRCL